MGQQASKAATQVAKNAKMRPPVPPPEGASRAAPPPPPQQSAKPPDSYPEMPSDLIKFMNDVGPLKRKDQQENLGRKSRPVAADADAGKQNHVPDPHNPQSRDRTSMRLAEAVEGFETVRSTSFSSKADAAGLTPLPGSVVDVFRLLTLRTETGSDQQAVDRYYQDYLQSLQKKDNDAHDSSSSPNTVELPTPDEEAAHRAVLQQVLQYLENPVLLRDTDRSLVGAWPDRVHELEQLKLERLPSTSFKPVLQDLLEKQQREENTVDL